MDWTALPELAQLALLHQLRSQATGALRRASRCTRTFVDGNVERLVLSCPESVADDRPLLRLLRCMRRVKAVAVPESLLDRPAFSTLVAGLTDLQTLRASQPPALVLVPRDAEPLFLATPTPTPPLCAAASQSRTHAGTHPSWALRQPVRVVSPGACVWGGFPAGSARPSSMA
jgi:hypothetical protein